MAIEFRIGEIASKLIPLLKRNELPVAVPSEILGHKELFDFYGICCDDLNNPPVNGIIELKTRDGVLVIDPEHRVIVAPLKYYLSS